MSFADDDPPTVSILLLGDPSCGKSTFLSKLSHGSSSTRTTPLPHLPLLSDTNQPFIWTIRLYSQHYRFEFSDTSSPTPYTLLRPDFLILCYDISNPHSLSNLKTKWIKHILETGLLGGEKEVPVMVLGLKRDLRRLEMGEDGKEREVGVWPQEGVRVAQEMRADRYAECSAQTGELMDQVIEDVARGAARTRTEKGGLGEGGCVVM